MGIKYSYNIQLPHNIITRDDKLLRRFYFRTRKYNILKNNIKYKTYNLILFFCDINIELNYYVEFSKRLVGNNNIVYLFKNKTKQDIGIDEKLFSSELSILKKNLLIDYGIELKINKKILLSDSTNFDIIATNYIYIHNIIDKTLILNPKIDTHNINLFNIFLNTYKSTVYIVYTKDYNIDIQDTKKIIIPENNIIFTKEISSTDIYNINLNIIVGVNNNITKWDEFANIINRILLII